MYFAGYDDKEIARLKLSISDIYFLEWFINYQHSNKMEELPDNYKSDDKHYYWLKFTKIIHDLPALGIGIKNNTSICKMVNRICGKGKINEHEYPLIKVTHNIHNTNKSYYAIRWEVISKMKGFEDELGIDKLKKAKKEPLCSLNINVEKILTEIAKIKIPDGRKLFSYTIPDDHKIKTQGMRKFQQACFDLYDGKLNFDYVFQGFKDRNKYYITNDTTKKIKDDGKDSAREIKNAVKEKAIESKKSKALTVKDKRKIEEDLEVKELEEMCKNVSNAMNRTTCDISDLLHKFNKMNIDSFSGVSVLGFRNNFDSLINMVIKLGFYFNVTISKEENNEEE